jgi:putative ABC transport system permease protein
MPMIPTIAWRNIWRNKRRSVIGITTIAIGVTALLLTDAIYNGMLTEMLDSQIRSHIAHLQIHAQGFNDNKVIQNSIADVDEIERILRNDPNVEFFSRRVSAFGIVSSASNSSGVSVIGIDPQREQLVTKIRSSIVAGTYLDSTQNKVIVSKKLAEKLSVELDDKIVLMASALDGRVGSDVFRIVGIFETAGADFDRTFLFIPITNAQRMMGLGARICEIAVIVKSTEGLGSTQASLQSSIGPAYEVLSYRDLIPSLIMIVDIGRKAMIIYYLIIGIAILFGITNTMLMAVFERTRELGILMATGMKNVRLFGMIICEALFLSAIGTFIGICVGIAVYLPLTSSGIDLGSVAEGLTMVGASPVIHPALTVAGLVNALTIIPLISMLAAVYPAYKATGLEPVQAIQYV